MSSMPSIRVPATIKKLPNECLIVSYDAESVTTKFTPGCTLSFAAVASTYTHDYGLYIRPFSHWRMNCIPQVPYNKKSEAFWNRHPDTYRQLTYNPSKIDNIFNHFYDWLYDKVKLPNTKPLILLARPHAYDVKHLLHGLEAAGLRQEFMALNPLFADSRQLVAHAHGLNNEDAKAHLKQFLPERLLHEPVSDSFAQLFGTIAALQAKPGEPD